MWMEDKNETRQALIYFSTVEEMKKLIDNKKIPLFKSSPLTFEKVSDELKSMSSIYFHLISGKSIEDQENMVQILRDKKIIEEIGDQLKKLNFWRKEQKERFGKYPIISANDLLLTKFYCEILHHIIFHVPSTIIEMEKINIPYEIIKLIHSLHFRFVSRWHTQILAEVLKNVNKDLKIELQKNEGIQQLNPILEHTSVEVKQDIISSMMYILSADEQRFQRREPFQYFSDLKREAVILFVNQNCFLHGETIEIQRQASIVLATILRAQELDPNMKLIGYFKRMIKEQTQSEQISEMLDLLCGLAMKKANVAEIASDNFIETLIIMTNSMIEDIKSYSLELLMTMIENGGTEIEQQIKNKIELQRFLELVGDSDEKIDERSVNINYKNYSNEQQISWSGIVKLDPRILQLQIIHRLFEIQRIYSQSFEEKQIEILVQQMIPQISFLLSEGNQQISESEHFQPINSLTIGIINCTCAFLTKIINKIQVAKLIIEQGIAKHLVDLLQHLSQHPNSIKQIHLDPLYNFSVWGSDLLCQKLQKLKAIQALSQFLLHPSFKIVDKAASCIYNITISGQYQVSYHSECELPLSYASHNFFFPILKAEGTLDQIEQSILFHQLNNNFPQILHESLVFIYRGYAYPSSLQNLTITSIKRSLQNKFNLKQDCTNEIMQLQNISTHQDNHESILNSGILQLLFRNITQFIWQIQFKIINLILILFEQGNQITHQKIKEIIPLDLIENLVERNNLNYLYVSVGNDEQPQKQRYSYEDFNLNRILFTLHAWIFEEDRMDKLIQIRNRFDYQQQDISIDQTNLKLQQIEKENLSNNLKSWEIIESMITIAKEMKDKELFEGAFHIISEEIYCILFDFIEKWNEEEIIKSISNFLEIFVRMEDDICFNMINLNICKWFRYVIEECQQQSLQLKDKVISAVAFISIRGALMSRDDESNHYSDYFNKSNLDKTLENLVVNEPDDKEKEQRIRLLEERIQFNASIGFCCSNKEFTIDDNIIQICTSIFCLKLNTFNQLLKQLQYSIQSSSKSEQNDNIEIEADEIQIITNILLSIACIGTDFENSKTLINLFNIHEQILPLIHFNCNCLFNISHINTQHINNLVSTSIFALSQLMDNMDEKMVNNLNIQHNLYHHIITFILFNSEHSNHNQLIPSIKESNINSLPTYTSIHQINSSLKILSQIVIKQQQFANQIILQPNLTKKIMQIALLGDLQNINSKQSLNAQYYSMKLIRAIILSTDTKIIDWMIHQQKLMNVWNLMSEYSQDQIISASISILSTVIINLRNKTNDSESKKLEDEVRERIEVEGLIEFSADLFIFHSDNRGEQGVKNRKKLFELAGLISEAVDTYQPRGEIHSLSQELLQQMRMQFAMEEKLMVQVNFASDEKKKHSDDHLLIRQRMTHLLDYLSDRNDAVVFGAIPLFSSLLTHHFTTLDQELGQFYAKETGIDVDAAEKDNSEDDNDAEAQPNEAEQMAA